MKSGVRTHPVGCHDQTGKHMLEPGCGREWSRAFQCEGESVEQSLGQDMEFGDRVIVRCCRSPLLSDRRSAGVDAWSRDRFAVMAENGIENALRVVAPLVDGIGMDGCANGIRQCTAGI